MKPPGSFADVRRDVAFPMTGGALLAAVLIVGGAVYSVAGGATADKLVTAMLIDAIMVVGLQIYIGNTGVFSFGHIGFAAVAGYTFAVLAIEPARKSTVIRNAPWGLNEVHLSPVQATAAAALVTLVAAVVVGLGLARSGAKSGSVSAAVITLALLFVTHELALNWTDLTGGDRAGLSFRIGNTLEGRTAIYVVLVIVIVVARLFAQSRIGRLAQAAREDNLAARAMGVNPVAGQMVALLLSVLVVAVAASLRVYDIGNITPKFFFFDYTLLTLVMLIVGGRNSVTGALSGVVIITAGRELTRRFASDGFEFFGVSLDAPVVDWLLREGLTQIFLGAAMLGFMILRANGLLGDWELDAWLWRRWRRRKPEERPEPLAEIAPVGLHAEVDHEGAALEVHDLAVDFGGFRALDGAGLTVAPDEVVGLIGPNGAGKTTLVNVITGVVVPSAGWFKVGERELTGAPSHDIARAGLVRTFQNLRLFGALTVRQNVELAARVAAQHRPGSHPPVDALVAEAGLWDVRDRRARELDYGSARRLELARAAAMAPAYLLLDEPTSGMSDAESAEMIGRIRHMAAAVDAGVLVIDHDLNFITGISDRIYVLDQGQVISVGTPDEVQADPAVRAAYLGAESDAEGRA